jgi:hypothetical protein
MGSRSIVQLCSSIYLALVSFTVAIIVTNNLTYIDRQNYGIFMVSLGQLFVFIQFGTPGAFNSVGLAIFKSLTLYDIWRFFLKKLLGLSLATSFVAFFFNLPPLASFVAFLGYSALIPLQWLVNGFQKHVSNLEYSFWRVLSTSIQLVIVLLYYSTERSFTLFFFVEFWCISNVLSLALLIVRFANIKFRLLEVQAEYSLIDISKAGRTGLVAHIGLNDLIKLENFLIPFFLPVIYSAHYFAIGGLANWPRLIIDSLALSYFHDYKSQSIAAGRKSALRRLCIVLVSTLSILAIMKPIGDEVLESILGPQYASVFNLFYAMSAMTLLSSGRRMYLDSFRAHGDVQSIIASKLETRSWLISLISLPTVFYSDSIIFWAWSSAFTNLVALIYLIRKGNRCQMW